MELIACATSTVDVMHFPPNARGLNKLILVHWIMVVHSIHVRAYDKDFAFNFWRVMGVAH